MKQKINVIVISVLAVALLIVSFVFAVNYRNNNTNYFHDSGYIINSSYESGTDKINKLYFDVETSYSSSKEDTYAFTNTEGDKVYVSDESFVHYTSGAIMSLKKGVAIDLNDVDAKLISYYNVFEGSVLNKKNEVYEIDNLGDKISFSKLMFKISNNKYLIASKNIIASFSDNQTVEFKNYIEIEYVSENVIKIYNDEINYQTIASNLYLIIDDIKIDLEYKTISKNNIQYLTMADMVINSNDNIEILPEKEEVVVPEEETAGNSGFDNPTQGGSSGENTGTNIDGGFDNLINSLPGQNEQIDTEDEFVQPKFKVDDMKVTTLGFENLQLSFEDESSVLYGNRTVEILENSTGKVIQSFDAWEEGMPNYIINSYFGLKPNTEYTINVVGQYKIEDTIYDRTFISKIFRTLDIGLEIVEDYVTSDSLSFAVYKNSYSEVSGFSYDIKDKKGNIIVENNVGVSYGSSDVLLVTVEDKFDPNSEYIFTVKNIAYGNDTFVSELYQSLSLTHKAKTLKENPFKNDVELDININNQKNTVVFSVDGLNDIYGGIVNYTYNIYNEYNELIKTVVSEDENSLSLNRNDLNADSVYFDVLINFDDNEKTVMYNSNSSKPISLIGVVYPNVVEFVPVKDNEDHEKLIGYIAIDDEKDFIKYNNISKYKIVVKEKTDGSLLGSTQQIIAEYIETKQGIIELPVLIENLKPQTEYIMSVYLDYNGKSIYIGYVTAKTSEASPVYLNINDKEGNSGGPDTLFDFSVSLTPETEELKNNSANHLNYLEFVLYGCYSDSQKIQECTNLKYSAMLPESQSAQELYDIFTDVGALDVLSNDFDFYIDDYKSEYTNYRVRVIGHSYGYEMPIYVNGEETNEFTITFNKLDPELRVNPVEIVNETPGCGEFCDNTLKNDTVVGYKFEVTSLENPMGEYISQFYYSIERLEYNEWKLIDDLTTVKVEIGSARDSVITLSDDVLVRGYTYRMNYYGKYGKDGNTDNETKLLYSDEFSINKQKPDIEGYLASYKDSNLKFNLNVTDPDAAFQKYKESIVVLVDTSDGTLLYPKINGSDYTFEDVESEKNYKLKANENILAEASEKSLFEVKLEKILNLNDRIEISANGGESGKIGLSVTSDDSTLLSRIVGVEILSDDSTMHYFTFTDRSESELNLQLNLRTIKDSKLGKISGKKLVFNKINVIYDSGAMVDSSSTPMFIKWRNRDAGNLDYFDYENNRFTQQIKLNYGEFENIAFNKKSLIDNSSIGYYLQSDNLNRNILLNEAATISFEKIEVDNIVDVLSTDKIETVYKTAGAKIKFKLIDEIKDQTKFKFELMNGAEISSEVYEYNNSELTEIETNGTKITNATNNGSEISVEFSEFDDSQNYKYSISYSIDEGQNYIYVYDEENQVNVSNIEITSLKYLPITDDYLSTHTSNTNWHWDTDYNDLTFEKKINNYFEVDHSKYELENNESIRYSIVAVNVNDNSDQTNLVSSAEINKETKKYNNVIDLNEEEFSKLKGNYEIQLISYVTKNGETLKELEKIILNEIISINSVDPTFKITNNGTPVFGFTMYDPYGLLRAFKNADFDSNVVSNVPITFFDKNSKSNYIIDSNTNKYFEHLTTEPIGAKAVYFVIYREDKFIGYLPIPFVYNTLTLDLTQHFVTNQLASGEYTIKLYYMLGDTLKTQETTVRIYNSSMLNVSVLDFPQFYMLLLNNPDEGLKDSIDSITYQYYDKDGNRMVKHTLTGDNLKYAINTNQDSTTTYLLALETGGKLTSTLENLTIQFYDGDNLIYTYAKN